MILRVGTELFIAGRWKVSWYAGIWGGVSCSTKRGKTSSFSLGKKKQKPERHARSGKSPHSPHFRCGRARSRDVGCQWDGSRPACAFPPRKRASGFACTPLRRRSALAGAWLRGRVKPSLGLGKGVSRKREAPEWLQPTTSLGDGGREPQAPEGGRGC